ncbi:hypothetical protein GIB67_027450 [Kingdonia uniflora]|uniref:Arginyl-tRNA--protein transferase n=1 Tax=Kingdonia uniflora TaxID=39325 RepID=A0A7J7MF96_9MAGN|nr:hypothetical protein GIB67_027450 [Kingdonia uniflora]
MATKTRSEASSSSNSNRGESVVMDLGRRRSSCGYCKSDGRSSSSHGLWAHSITVDDYQDLLDRGWRRSGCYLYKPDMEKTCCPSYTIRINSSDFVPSKEQSRVSRRMQRFLDGALDGKKGEESKDAPTHTSLVAETSSANSKEKNDEDQNVNILSLQIDDVVCGMFPSDAQLPKASVKHIIQAKKKKLIGKSEDILYSSNISFQIAAALNRSKLADQSGKRSEVFPQSVAEKLACSISQIKEFSDLTVTASNGHLNFCSAKKQVSTSDIGATVNASSCPRRSGIGKCNNVVKSKEHPLQKRKKLEIRLNKSSFDPEEYALYRRYQIKVHNDLPDQVKESSYRRFLVDTPIVFVPPSSDCTVPPCGFGSFHQQYVIDGRLVAVGVVDILPRCLSSKYLFWDPDLAFLSLGKYSALQELDWVKENQVHCPSLQYYYLGYYIHSCSKMRYKAAYWPSELLCPLRYKWVSFDIARPLLDKKSYVILSDFASLQNEDPSSHMVLENPFELQHHDPSQENQIEYLSDEDEEMVDPYFEGSGSDDDLDPETSGTEPIDELVEGEVGNILMGIKDSRMRFRDLLKAYGSIENNYLKLQLHGYMKVVGAGLSERMVYSLG